MFSILIHDEFADSIPDLWEEFDNITDAVGYFNTMKDNDKVTRYGDGIELVLDHEDICGHPERITLDYYSY